MRQAVDDGAGDGFCAACHETTGGNPFLVRELLHEVIHKRLKATDAEAAAVRALGPEAISTVVLQRLKRLPASAPAMARAVAILGEGAKPALAARARRARRRDAPRRRSTRSAAPTSSPATSTTGSASCTRSCSPRSTPTCPVHARSDGHARAARLLQRARGDRLAHRPHRAPRRRLGGRALRAAAARALALGDPATAVAHLERALEEPPPEPTRAAVLAELARAETQSGRPAAEQHFRAGDRGSAADPHERGQIAIGLARCLKFRGDSPRAIDVLRHALAELDPDDPLAEELEIELVGLGLHLARRAAAARRRDRPHPGARRRHHRSSTACT